MSELEKYKNEDGKIGVLYSPGFGAGWSTWGGDEGFLSMDKTLVEMKINKTPEDEVKEYIKVKTGQGQYMGGWDDCEIAWAEEGSSFNISEYDGAESIQFVDNRNLTA